MLLSLWTIMLGRFQHFVHSVAGAPPCILRRGFTLQSELRCTYSCGGSQRCLSGRTLLQFSSLLKLAGLKAPRCSSMQMLLTAPPPPPTRRRWYVSLAFVGIRAEDWDLIIFWIRKNCGLLVKTSGNLPNCSTLPILFAVTYSCDLLFINEILNFGSGRTGGGPICM